MEAKLNALRREALIDILKEMKASPARIEDWVHQIFITAIQPPPVVSHCAGVLGQWNCYGNSPQSHQGNVRFAMSDVGDVDNGYEAIAELVLTTAREFEGQAKVEKEIEPKPIDRPAFTIPQILDMLQAMRVYLSEIIGESSATGYAKELKRIIECLEFMHDNYRLVPKTQ